MRRGEGEKRGRALAALLAAGRSSRFGRPKQLARISGLTLVERAVRSALASSADEVCVVVGAFADEVAEAVEGLGVVVVRNTLWEQGQASSVAAAVKAAEERHCEYVALVPVDMALVGNRHLDALFATARQNTCSVVSVSECGAMAPCVFDAENFAALSMLEGDRGAVKIARALLCLGKARGVPFADGRMAFDIDTPGDLERAVEMLDAKGNQLWL